MRVVVTGSSGHVGGAIAQYLHAQGHDVVGVSRSYSSSLPPAIPQISLDIGAPEFVNKAQDRIGHCDAIVHAAACLDEDASRTDISRTNCLGTHQILVLAEKLGVHTFTYISGVNLLGQPVEHPVTESHAVNPQTIYAASKLYSEQISMMAGSPVLRTICCRVSSPVGPGLVRQRIFRLFVENALENNPIVLDGTGGRRQDYVDVRDVARAVEACITLESVPVKILNIASGCPVSNLELANQCVETLKSKSKIVFSGKEDPQNSISWDMNIEKAGELLGYAPQYPLCASIADLAAEIRKGK